MNIKLEQYKIFNEAASTLSFSLAARNLFISQSAVSQAIHTLEKELNTQLFIRQSKGVVLTKDCLLYTSLPLILFCSRILIPALLVIIIFRFSPSSSFKYKVHSPSLNPNCFPYFAESSLIRCV